MVLRRLVASRVGGSADLNRIGDGSAIQPEPRDSGMQSKRRQGTDLLSMNDSANLAETETWDRADFGRGSCIPSSASHPALNISIVSCL